MSSGAFHRREVLKGHPVSECPSFLGLSNIPLCGWTAHCLSIVVSGHSGFYLLTVVNAGVRCWVTFENRNPHERPGLYLGVSEGVSPVVVGQPLAAEITAGVCVCPADGPHDLGLVLFLGTFGGFLSGCLEESRRRDHTSPPVLALLEPLISGGVTPQTRHWVTQRGCRAVMGCLAQALRKGP